MDVAAFAAVAGVLTAAVAWSRRDAKGAVGRSATSAMDEVPGAVLAATAGGGGGSGGSGGGGTGYAGKVVLVTAASSGIGRAIAIAAAAAGARVAFTYFSNADEAAATEAACRAAAPPGADIRAYRVDLDDASGREAARLVAAVLADFGAIHVLVNNYGRFLEHKLDAPTSSFDTFRAHWADSMTINATSAAHMSYLVAAHMRERRASASASTSASTSGAASTSSAAPPPGDYGFPPDALLPSDAVGAIINVGSRGAFRGEPTSPGYGAAKAAMHAMTQCFAVALGAHGIVVAAVAPGFVATPRIPSRLHAGEGATICGQSSWHRTALPEEVAASTLFLAAYWRNPWVTGTILDCNGASYLRT